MSMAWASLLTVAFAHSVHAYSLSNTKLFDTSSYIRASKWNSVHAIRRPLAARLTKTALGTRDLNMGQQDQGSSVKIGSGLCNAAVTRYWKGMNERNVEFALDQFSDKIFFQVLRFHIFHNPPKN